MKNCEDIRQELIRKYKENDFVIDKTGCKTVEIISANFIVNRDWLIRKPNYEYATKEIAWYISQSTNINDIYGKEKAPPQAWVGSADKYGNINSNYGYLISSPKYFSQYYNCLEELQKNKDSRRAVMIYNRPSIWEEYKEGGKSDFICTFANQFFIRNGKLVSIYNMRSNDAVFGFCNDSIWAKSVHIGLATDLKIPVGDLIWNAGSLHVYERHFKFLEDSYDPEVG